MEQEKQPFDREEDCCGNCKFWLENPEPDPNGQCREDIPQCVAIPMQVPVIDKKSMLVGGEVKMQMQFTVNGYFPPTGAGIWCSKHRRRVN